MKGERTDVVDIVIGILIGFVGWAAVVWLCGVVF
jgi:hypothetical protein